MGSLSALSAVSLLLASSLVFFAPATALPSPGTSVPVDVGPGIAASPSLAVDATGLFHLVRSEDPAGERGVWYTRSTNEGATWSASTRIDTPTTTAYWPRMAVEREPVGVRGRLYVVYQLGAGSAADIWYTFSDGGSFWNPPRQVDSAAAGVASISPSVAASNNRVYVTWSDLRPGSYQTYARVSPDAGSSWGPEVQLSSGGVSALQSRVDAKGDTAVVVWRLLDGGGASIWSSRSDDGGATWQTSVVAYGASATDNLRDPDVFLDELKVAHVAWTLTAAGGETHVHYAASGDGLVWSPSVRVDDIPFGVRSAFAPSITALAGTLWVAWHDNRYGNYDIFASWSEDGVTWGDGVPNGIDLRVDDTGRNANPTDDATHQWNATLRTGGYGVYVAWEDARNSAPSPTPPVDVYFGSVAVSPLVITEIQDEPSPEARVEIYNLGRTPYSLSGVSLVAGVTTVSLAPVGSIGARSHIVVGAATGSDLQVSLDMGSEGARVQLLEGTDVIATAGSGTFGIAPDPLPGESTARYAGTLDYTSAWTRATAPSFRARNTVTAPHPSPPVVLNEVLFNPSVPGERFVELTLRAPTIVDLTGYRVISDSLFTFSSGSMSPASPFVFLLEGKSPGWFAPLATGADNVYLYDGSGRLLDMVGWSSSHVPGKTVSRLFSGVGGLRAYDDPSAAANGWAFNQDPSIALLTLVSDQRVMADIGTTVQFPLTATNLQTEADAVNVEATAIRLGWSVTFRWTNGTVLTDSSGDGIPDLGPMGPGAAMPFLADVAVPLEGILGDGNVITVTARAASFPAAQDDATLSIDLYPHFDTARTVNPSQLYLEGTGPPYNENAQITISVSGAGLPIVTLVPHDVVFQIDESGSMNGNDPFNIRVQAVKEYIDGMQLDDRGALIGFTDTAWVVNNRPLTYADAMGKVILKADADTLACSPGCGGWTNIDTALQLGTDLLVTQGIPTRPRIEILLTDGSCQPTPCTDTNNILNQAVAAGIVIYTIGLGDGVDEAFLQNIATTTGGRYYRAYTAQDLLGIYEEIGTRVNRTAGIDPDVTDSSPMIEDAVAPYLNIVPGSFYDPVSGAPRPPAYVEQLPDRTRLQWNVSRIQINETWSVQYTVTSVRVGVQDVALHPDARVAYARWDNSTVFQPIPQGTLNVLRAATPPYITVTSPADGATNVDLTQPISAIFSQDMVWASVAWAVSPPIGETPSYLGRMLTLNHAGLAECTQYTVEVTQGLDTDGESLVPGPVPNPWSFTTVCPSYVTYTITRSPLYGEVLVNGVNSTVPATFTWLTGTLVTLSAPDIDLVGASRLVFLNWSDGGARDHAATVGDVDATIVANYAWQHRVDLTLLGLDPGRPAAVRFRLWNLPSSAPTATTWTDFVDDRSEVDVDSLLLGVTGERFITFDQTQWTITAPTSRVVGYHHQFVVIIRTTGLEGHEVDVDFTAFGLPEGAATSATWTSWVDAGRPVRVDDLLVLGAPQRERYRTLRSTEWTVDAPLDETVPYLHQFRVRVTVRGLDENHTVGGTWMFDWELQENPRLSNSPAEVFEWADALTFVAFDSQTTGTPPRYALRSPQFFVDRAFDEELRYAPRAPPPPSENWKPLLSFVYVIGLLAAGATFSRRYLDRYVPGKGDEQKARKFRWANLPLGLKFRELSVADVNEKVHRDRRFTRLLLMLPFAGAEGAIGLASLVTGILRIPDGDSWLPLGFWVNTALLAAGLVVGLGVHRKGYRMSDEALLRLAEAREGSGKAS